MAWIFPWLLFLHVMSSIVAFGPTYAFGTYAGLAAQERGPALAFNNRARALVGRRMVMPGTFLVLITGALMIWARDIAWLEPAYRWLQLAIVLYVGMLAWNMTVSVARQRRIAELGAQAAAQVAAQAAERAGGGGSAAPKQGGPPPGAGGPPPGAGGPPPGGGGPPPEMAALIHKARRDGKVMGVLTVFIVFLMVVKPQVGM